MANRYWVGGTGTWNTSSTTNWSTSSGGASGASVPTAADNVFFDQAGTYTVTLTGALTCLNITVSAGTVTFSSTGTLAVSGSMSLVAATVWNATGTITFNSTSAGNTVTTNAVTISSSITFNGVGGTWQLQGVLTSGATRACTLTAGTLDLNNYTLTIGSFSTNNSNTRTLAFGTGKIVLTGNTGTVWTNATGTGFTYTGTSRIEAFGPATTGTRTFNPSTVATSTEANALNFYITGGSDTVNFSTTNRRINGLNFTGFTGTFTNSQLTIHGSYTISTGMTVVAAAEVTTFAATTSQTITTNGKTLDFPITFDGVGGTWQLQDALTSGSTRTCTLTNGTLNLNGYTLTTGIFSSNNANARTLAFAAYESITVTGRNTTVFDTSNSNNFTVTYSGLPDDNYIILDAAGIAGETRSILTGLVSSGGTQLNSNNFAIAQGADTISFGASPSVFRSISFFNATFTGSLAANAMPQIYGKFVFLSNTMTIAGGTNAWSFLITYDTTTFDTKGLLINNPITINTGSSYGVTLIDVLDIGSTNALTLTSGTLKLYRNLTSTVGSLVTTGTNQKYLQSSTAGTQATISAASGVNSVSYLTIKDIAATGGATWNAFYDLGNINAGNNSGWYFGDSPTVGNEITMRLRSFTQPRRF